MELPNLAHGKLADLINAAKAPGLASELSGELGARAMFDQVAKAWPKRTDGADDRPGWPSWLRR